MSNGVLYINFESGTVRDSKTPPKRERKDQELRRTAKKPTVITHVKTYQETMNEYVDHWKMKRGCRVCGFKSYAGALDLLGVDLSVAPWTFEKLRAALEAHAVVVCANHHRMVDAGELRL